MGLFNWPITKKTLYSRENLSQNRSLSSRCNPFGLSILVTKVKKENWGKGYGIKCGAIGNNL
jgi:hypothetical protein